jgi:predicted nucleotidyltransferase
MPDNKLNIIKQTINDIFPGCKILLFGSRARHDHDSSSDYDLIIIVDQKLDIAKKWFFQAKIRTLLAKFKIPVDLIIQSKSELEINKTLSGHIIRSAIREGIFI